MRLVSVVVLVLCVAATAVLAVSGNQLDDFQNGTVQSWQKGSASSLQPTNIANGGPAGAGDNYLQVVSLGGGGADSRMAVFNDSQWSGNYVTAGVRQIEMDMANFGVQSLDIRIAIDGGTFAGGGPGNCTATCYSSNFAVNLPADGQWRNFAFLLNTSSMVRANGSPGSEPLSTVLSSAIELRIVAGTSPDWIGMAIAGTLGIDNVLASTVPVELQSFTVE
jgi:hypothetical protein